MSIPFAPEVQAALDSGRYVPVHLVRFDIPGFSVGYWRGARDFTWNGFTYKPSRYLDDSGLSEIIGVDITERSLTFSDVPTDDNDDVIAKIETYQYLNAPVIVAKLIGDVEADEILGLVESSRYEISEVRYQKSPVGEDGARTVTMQIELEIPGRVIRDSVGGKYSAKEHQAHNDASDTFFDYSAVNGAWPVEFGQVVR